MSLPTDAILERIKARPRDTRPERTYRCFRCRDTGLIENVTGRFDVGHGRRETWTEATELRPIYQRCKCSPPPSATAREEREERFE